MRNRRGCAGSLGDVQGAPTQRAHVVPRSVHVAGGPVHGHPGLELNWAQAKPDLSLTFQHPGRSPGSGEDVPPSPHTRVPEPLKPGGHKGGFACPAAPVPTVSPGSLCRALPRRQRCCTSTGARWLLARVGDASSSWQPCGTSSAPGSTAEDALHLSSYTRFINSRT